MVDCASTFFAGGFLPPAGRDGVEEDAVAGGGFAGSEAAVQVSVFCEEARRRLSYEDYSLVCWLVLWTREHLQY